MVPRPRMKPRFSVPVGRAGERVLVRLGLLLQQPGCPVVGDVRRRHAFIQLPRHQRSLLSPYLDLTLVDGDDGEHLVGRFSPHPHVWTGFMAIYGVLGMSGLCGLVYGWAHALNGDTSPLVWSFPVSLAAIAFVYGAAVIGQGLTAGQMYTLRSVVDRALLDVHEQRVPRAESLDQL